MVNCKDKSARDESDDHERFKRIVVVSHQRNVKKVAPTVQSHEKSYFLGKLQSTAGQTAADFQPFGTTSIHRVDPYRDEISSERFVGRYIISTRTQLEVLPRNLCPLINDRRLLLVLVSKLILQADETNDKIKTSFTI